MTILINILFIILNPIANNQIQNHKYDYIHFDYSHYEIVIEPVAEITPENFFSNSEQIINEQVNYELNATNATENIFTTSYNYSFLNRLLPFLIDVPPPSSHLI